MTSSFFLAFGKNFLDHAPGWYKGTILGFLILNPCLLYTVGPFVTGWCLSLECIFTLAMALKKLAPMIRLSYGKMLWMAFPYTVTMTITGLLAVFLLLQPVTQTYYSQGLLAHHVPIVAELHHDHGVPVP